MIFPGLVGTSLHISKFVNQVIVDAVVTAIFDRLSPVAAAASCPDAELMTCDAVNFTSRQDLWAKEGSHLIEILLEILFYVIVPLHQVLEQFRNNQWVNRPGSQVDTRKLLPEQRYYGCGISDHQAVEKGDYNSDE